MYISLSAILPLPGVASLIESSVRRRYLEELDGVSCESVHKQRQWWILEDWRVLVQLEVVASRLEERGKFLLWVNLVDRDVLVFMPDLDEEFGVGCNIRFLGR